MSCYYKYLLSVLGLFAAVVVFSAVSAGFPGEMSRQEAGSACGDCHEEGLSSLRGTVHSVPEIDVENGVSCIDCHQTWEAHLDDPSAENITAGPEASLAEQAEICSGCHLNTHQAAMLSTDPHNIQGLNCSSCHAIHNNTNESLVTDDRQDFCLRCHKSVAADFKLRSSHPFGTGNVRCTDCHDLSGLREQTNVTGSDWGCQNCHPEKSGPFVYEHPVVYSHLVEGEGCTECHKPHGSPNDRLLTQAGNAVCSQCHGTPVGHRTQHSGLGAKMSCVDCHSEIHGSFDNRLFLDPDLGTRFFPDCYQSGCHIQGD